MMTRNQRILHNRPCMQALCLYPIMTGPTVIVYPKMVVNAHKWPPSFLLYFLESSIILRHSLHRSLISLPSVISLGVSKFRGSQVLLDQPAFEIGDNLAGGFFREPVTDTTLDFSPVEMLVPFVSSMEGEVCAEMVACVVRTPDLLIAPWEHARELADRAMHAQVSLQVLSAGKCCVARLSIATRRDTDEWLLFDVVIGVNEAIAFEVNSIAL